MSDRPSWLKVRANSLEMAEGMRAVRDILATYDLTTVCQQARCPNAAECWGLRTATFMLLGSLCTRACRFCAVPTGNPHGSVDEAEPLRVAEACRALGLKYVVLTSVDRDDLQDGGASLFAESISQIKHASTDIRVEALIPDFAGDEGALRKLAATSPEVIGHNLETVRRLSPLLRDSRASYDLSLSVLNKVRQIAPQIITKSSLMLGLGERKSEVISALEDLRDVGVRALTLGQYLQPSHTSAPVARYVQPKEFASLETKARNMGFCFVMSGPLVRSSYRAAHAIDTCSG